jgi:hypothetical protein
VTDDRDTGFRRNLIPECGRVGGEVPRALERARCRPAPAADRRALDGGREAGLSFRGRDDAERLGDVVKFHWEAVAKDGDVFAVGLNFLVFAADGRIERDYTFIVA